MNAFFNPEAISACLNVIFDEEDNQSQTVSSFSAPKLTRRKCISAIRQLAYSYKADALDEYLQIAQDTGYQCLDAFYKCVIHLYQHEYLRRPTEVDIEWLTAKHEQVHGFPGIVGSKDCMHWGWRNSPVAWQGQYTRGDKGHPTIMLEADRAPQVEFSVNGHRFGKGYYLANGIYPEWATLVKSFKCPMDPKTTKFKRYQEAARKDVERAFGVLQGHWQIVEQQARAYSVNKIKHIMLCV
uniref:uncharacterized protein LOC122596865 n=1 Tax=Erigeron canadensis TaxID=72917 RepID=UPI001CB9A8D0|nr:uncharacterized protein LOC122596865 [Erigeron canadensis]